MFCQFCGTQIPEGDQFCGSCGARAPLAPGSPASPPPQPYADRPAGEAPAYGAPAGQQDAWRAAYFDRDPNAPSVGQRYEYAGFWIRFGAWLLDSIFALLLALVPAVILAVVLFLAVESSQDPPLTIFEAEQQDDDTSAALVIGFLLGLIPVSLGYWYVGTSLGGAWGKRLCGIRIIKYEDGDRPGFGTGAVRVLVTVVIGLINLTQLLDHFWMIWDKDKQTWHDKAAGTVVVRV